MKKQFALAVGILALILSHPPSTSAATNPDLESFEQARVIRFTGTERLSQPFSFDIEVTITNPALNFSSVVGQPLQIQVAPGRRASGMVENIEQMGVSGRQGQYRVRIVPGLNRLAYRIGNRTFGDMNPMQVVTALLNEAGISGLEARLNGPMSAEEIIMQYQESDLAFLSRILENEGIHYHFELAPSGEKVVLGDSNNAFPILPPGKLVFGEQTTPSITAFSRGQAVHSGHVQAGDFNWRTPQANMTAAVQTPLFSDLTEGVFPASVDTQQESQQHAAIRLGARVTEGQSCRGESTYPQLQPGYRFLLAGHPRNDFNQEYVITGVNHEGTLKGYRNTFTCLPANVAFRPSPLTPQPQIAGVLPAIVVGPQGETKFVDEFGRVRVRFPWLNPSAGNSTQGDAGWVRVAQIATGAGNTSMWIPDIGDEVLVAFEHGDPHRPVIIGDVWNGNDPPPVQLPHNKTQTILRSMSIPGGTIPLELVMEAAAGQEELTLRVGNQFIQLNPKGIVASSTIQTQSPTIKKFPPPAALKTPTRPLVPRR
ncbi:MAG: type VI secretion system Vgr family protein [Nitrospirales bacterium]